MITKIDAKMEQEKELIEIIESNKSVNFILNNARELNLPGWYLGAGGITQTVWNVKSKLDPENGIKDYDLVYCDVTDLSQETQDRINRKAKEIFKDIRVPVEVVNEARVYQWYQKENGYDLDQEKYTSTEQAIDVWPTTATAVGVRKEGDGNYKIYAPFGLGDLLGLIVRANKRNITEATFQKKVDRWSKVWPNLVIIPW